MERAAIGEAGQVLGWGAAALFDQALLVPILVAFLLLILLCKFDFANKFDRHVGSQVCVWDAWITAWSPSIHKVPLFWRTRSQLQKERKGKKACRARARARVRAAAAVACSGGNCFCLSVPALQCWCSWCCARTAHLSTCSARLRVLLTSCDTPRKTKQQQQKTCNKSPLCFTATKENAAFWLKLKEAGGAS